MKKFFVFCLLLLFNVVSFAQTKAQNTDFVHLYYTNNKYTSISTFDPHDYRSGVSFDLGSRIFPKKDARWFFEWAVEFFFNDLPFAEQGIPGDYTQVISVGNKYLREIGPGTYTDFGYDFILNQKMSLSLYAGPGFRYVVRYYYDNKVKGNLMHKANLKLRFGAGLNINNTNINLSIAPDMLDRGVGVKRYRSLQVSLGIGYYFK